jgi:hypothetical protein
MEIKYAIRKHDRLLHGNTELTSIVCHRQADGDLHVSVSHRKNENNFTCL